MHAYRLPRLGMFKMIRELHGCPVGAAWRGSLQVPAVLQKLPTTLAEFDAPAWRAPKGALLRIKPEWALADIHLFGRARPYRLPASVAPGSDGTRAPRWRRRLKRVPGAVGTG